MIIRGCASTPIIHRAGVFGGSCANTGWIATFSSFPSRRYSTLTGLPPLAAIASCKRCIERSGWPLALRSTSPICKPAFSAGIPGEMAASCSSASSCQPAVPMPVCGSSTGVTVAGNSRPPRRILTPSGRLAPDSSRMAMSSQVGFCTLSMAIIRSPSRMPALAAGESAVT